MFFLLQKEKDDYDIDILILKNILDDVNFLHDYSPMKLSDFISDNPDSYPKYFQKAIPVGTIDFVDKWLKIFTSVKNQNPIEIPPCLRTDEFLKRKYSIVDKNDIPTNGRYFIKDASQLKVFSYAGEMNFLLHDHIWDEKTNAEDNSLHLNPDHLYQVSEIVNIQSEYRVYIISGEIQAIINYNGDPCVLPDINLIKKANIIYSMQKDYPKSYTMDIMVTDRGTSICEIPSHNSIGYYTTLMGSNLAYAYKDGIDYIVNHNTEPTKFSNFS
jgi:hypothetical protein